MPLIPGMPLLAGLNPPGHNPSWNNRFPDAIKFAATMPRQAIRDLNRADSVDMKGFTKVFWPHVEPGRKLVEGWPLDAIDDHLMAVYNGKIKKLIMNVPPGFMKSLKTCAFFPAYVWGPGGRPWVRFICASYDADLSVRDNRRCKMIIKSQEYQDLWGLEGLSAEDLAKPENKSRFKIVDDQDAKIKFETSQRGWKIATSVKGGVVGERGDIFIIDDPHNIKNVESPTDREGTIMWFSEIVPTRVNDPDDAVFIIIMQRSHERDVSGVILSEANNLGYEHLCIPMEWEPDHPFPSKTSIHWIDPRARENIPGTLAWPERYSQKALDDLKAQLRVHGGTYAEVGQLQQRPSPRGGGMFQRSWWRFYSESALRAAHRPKGCDDGPAIQLPTRFDQIIVSVDASFKKTIKGSRVSIMAIGVLGALRFVLDWDTRPMTFKESCDAIAMFTSDRTPKLVGGMLWRLLNRGWRHDRVLIEDKANGPAIVDSLSGLITGLMGVNPEGGKESRAAAMQPAVMSGQVLLPEGAPWLEDFVSELASFPVGARDDQVDTLSQALIFLLNDADFTRAIQMSKT